MKRIFVSSTFKDMHEERDILHYRVLPALNEYAKTTYGETLEFSDLRWGINTSELNDKESSLRVLSVCLDEVERCKPYMIVILGDRYGSIPDSGDVLICHFQCWASRRPSGPTRCCLAWIFP